MADFKPTFSWLLQRPVCFLGFGFGTGLAPVAPGTFGTLPALPMAFVLILLGIEGWWLAGLGVWQLAVPCVLAVVCARVLKPTEVSMLALLEVLFGIVLAWLGAGEVPSPAVWQGGALVLGALLTHLWLTQRKETSP